MDQTRIVVGIVLSALFGGTARSQCQPIGDAVKARLIDYVQKRFRTPTAAPLEISEISPVGTTCYRKLEFRAKDPRTFFRLDLFASPDLAFLSRELLDLSIDPAVEECQKAEHLASGLTAQGLSARGKDDASVTIAVFSDFQCPYCAKLAALMKDVLLTYPDKVRVVFHPLPLPMHQWARPAAEAAACAQEQSALYFWAFHDYLFEHQSEINRENLLGNLAEVGKSLGRFDESKFATCVIERRTSPKIDQTLAFAQENGITGTPTTFVNGRRIQISTADQLRTVIRELVHPAAATSGPHRQDAKSPSLAKIERQCSIKRCPLLQ